MVGAGSSQSSRFGSQQPEAWNVVNILMRQTMRARGGDTARSSLSWVHWIFKPGMSVRDSPSDFACRRLFDRAFLRPKNSADNKRPYKTPSMNGFWRSACVQRNARTFRQGHSVSIGSHCRSRINDPPDVSCNSGGNLLEENVSGGISPDERNAQQSKRM
jgi:hypothetical protein